MAWSAPRTWIAGELVTAAMMNAHVRDNLNALSDGDYVYASGSRASVVDAYLPVTLALGNSGGGCGVSGTRLQAGRAGFYLVGYRAVFPYAAAGERGTIHVFEHWVPRVAKVNVQTHITGAFPNVLAAGGLATEISVRQDSGSAMTVSLYTWMHRIGA